jgi:hypothetical protein
VDRVAATLRFDVAARRAEASAAVEFRGGEAAGRPALDLRQDLQWVRLDGHELPVDALAHRDIGAGWAARMRVLDVELEPGSRHLLEVGYELGTPDCDGALPLAWDGDGLRFDLWMSDLQPGRYLEMWVPAPLVQDRFALRLEVAVEGTDRPHTVLSNAGRVATAAGGQAWTLEFPAHFTALSHMLVVAPADSVEVRRSSVAIPGRTSPLEVVTARHRETDADLAAAESDLRSWLAQLGTRYEPWAHGDSFTAVIWAPGRGMEYDGATTASVAALEHEVFHSWFGRGVKPARASDGWIDEAWTTWSTASGRSETSRFAASELPLDGPPVLLYPPHPWSRHTPVESYRDGSALFAGLAHLLGGADRMRQAMADWYRANAGGLVTTDGLGAHLRLWSGVDINPWWARYVHGRS